MPELPEVEMVRRRLDSNCVGKRIVKVDVIDDGILDHISASRLAKALKGNTIVSVRRIGKQLFVEIESGKVLTVHLGLTGDVDCPPTLPDGERWMRFALGFDDGTALAYYDLRKFGAVGLATSIDDFVKRRKLGPDALSITENDFLARVSAHKKSIKSVLLDQHIVAGIGNLYADEALFQARLHPLTNASKIQARRLRLLHEVLLAVLRASIAVETDFERLPSGYLLRERRKGAPCPRGNGHLVSIVAAGRTTILCPRCQRLPRAFAEGAH